MAYLVIYGFASIIAWQVITGDQSKGSVLLLYVGSILVAGVSTVIPLFHILSAFTSSDTPSPLAVTITCPQCGNEQAHNLGEVRCEKFRSVFVVKIAAVGNIKSNS